MSTLTEHLGTPHPPARSLPILGACLAQRRAAERSYQT